MSKNVKNVLCMFSSKSFIVSVLTVSYQRVVVCGRARRFLSIAQLLLG